MNVASPIDVVVVVLGITVDLDCECSSIDIVVAVCKDDPKNTVQLVLSLVLR